MITQYITKLVTLRLPAQTLRMTLYNTPIIYDGNTYQPLRLQPNITLKKTVTSKRDTAEISFV